VKTTIGGRTVLAIFSGKELIGVDPQSGRRLWAFPWQTSYDVNAADPIFIGDDVFIASNYGKGGAMVSLAGGTPKQLWETRSMRNHFNTCILSGGHLFGNDENTLRCIDARSGAEKWALRGIGKGGLMLADGLLIVLSERGELILLDADPIKLTERSRSSILNGTCWSHPTLAGGCLYARSHEGTAVCVDLKRA
jgi:outer membrane protein assembly factor BamB